MRIMASENIDPMFDYVAAIGCYISLCFYGFLSRQYKKGAKEAPNSWKFLAASET